MTYRFVETPYYLIYGVVNLLELMGIIPGLMIYYRVKGFNPSAIASESAEQI
jgi:hypothetical protein